MKGISPALLEPLGQLEPLTNAQARTLSLVFTASYVGSIYVSTFFAGFSAASTRTQRRTGGTSIGQRNDKGVEGLEGQPGPEGPGDGVGIPPISASDTDAQALLKPPIRDDEMEEEMDDAPKAGDRDHPDTIKRRIAGVTAATGLSLGAVWYVVAVQGGTGFAQAIPSTITLLGLGLHTSPSASLFSLLSTPPNNTTLKALATGILPYALAPSMLLGPLYATYLDGDMPFQGSAPRDATGRREGEGRGDGVWAREWGRVKRWVGGWTWVEGRNYIAGPLSEELVFRSSLLAVSILARQTPRWLVFGTPLYFGIAHAHHAWNVYTKARKQGAGMRDALIPAVAGGVFQLIYTSLFGFFASYTHFRTGSVIPAIASHVFCNVMGIYMPTTAMARHPGRSKSILLAYVGGIAGFVWGIRRL